MKPCWIVFVLLLLLYSPVGLCQEDKLYFEHLGATEGLKSHDVQDLLQDQRGFIWIATLGGLHRFDGYQSKVYTHAPATPTSINNNLIYTLLEDQDQLLWIGTRHGLNVFNPKTEQFKSWNSYQNKPILEHRTIRHLYDDGQGYLWVCVSSEGLLRFNKKEQRFDLQYKNIPNIPNSLPSNLTKFVHRDKKGNWWVGTDNGLALFFPKTGEFFTFQHNPNNPFSLANDFVKCIYEDTKGNLWIGTDGGVSLIDLQVLPQFNPFSRIQVDFVNFTHEEDNPKSLVNNMVKSITQDENGCLWIGTDGGLSKFIMPHNANPEDLWAEKVFVNYTHNTNDERSLGNNYCKKVLIDKQGILWIGTAAGISKYDKYHSYFQSYIHENYNTNSLHDNFVKALAASEEPQGRGIAETMWVGTNSGVSKLNRQTGQWTLYNTTNGLPHNYVKALLYDNHTLWIGTDKGLARLQPSTNQIKTYIANRFEEGKLPENGITCFEKGLHKNIYIGTWHGVIDYSIEKDIFTPLLPSFKERVNDILIDYQGNVWVASREGLYCIDVQKKTAKLYNETSEVALATSYVLCLFEDAEKTLWIGTAGGGLFRFNTSKTTITKVLCENNGLLNNNILAIVEGKDQKLWVSTDKGLTRYDPQKGIVRNYTAADGLQNAGFHHLAMLQRPTGEVWLGGIKGLNTFFPTQIKDNEFNTPIYVIDCKIYQKSVEVGEQQHIKQHISYESQLFLTYADKMITLEFVGLNYRNPQQHTYRYKLENFDRDWTYATANSRQAVYTNLPAGEYKFVVEVINNDGHWSKHKAQLAVIVAPPIWETWWFICSIISVILGMIYGFIRWREQEHHYIKQQLESQVHQRTAELQARTTELEQANTLINVHLDEIASQRDEIEAQRSKVEKINEHLEETIVLRTKELQEAIRELNSFLYSAAHDLKAPVARLEGLIYLARLEKVDTVATEYLNKIEGLSKEMTKLIARMIRVHNVKTKDIVPQRIYFNELIEETLSEITKNKPISHIKIQTYIERCPPLESDYGLIKIILANLLNNAIDYQKLQTDTTEGKIMIQIHPTNIISDKNHTLQINIIDNGIGIDCSVRNKLFDMFFIGSPQSKGVGLGLYEAKLAVKRLGGEIGAEFSTQQTVFWVRL